VNELVVNLEKTVCDIADALVDIDTSRIAFRNYKPGVGPFGEPQLLRRIAEILDSKDIYRGKVRTRRTPDFIINDSWVMEFKIIRPFGDNGSEAENWSVNLLHPYEGNVSALVIVENYL